MKILITLIVILLPVSVFAQEHSMVLRLPPDSQASLDRCGSAQQGSGGYALSCLDAARAIVAQAEIQNAKGSVKGQFLFNAAALAELGGIEYLLYGHKAEAADAFSYARQLCSQELRLSKSSDYQPAKEKMFTQAQTCFRQISVQSRLRETVRYPSDEGP
jgi:hypothetical protein